MSYRPGQSASLPVMQTGLVLAIVWLNVSAVSAQGCDFDSTVGRVCLSLANEEAELISVVGTARELFALVAASHAEKVQWVNEKGDVEATLRFDEQGRFSTWEARGGQASFEYDSEGRLLKRSSSTRPYSYVGNGERECKAASGSRPAWRCWVEGSRLHHDILGEGKPSTFDLVSDGWKAGGTYDYRWDGARRMILNREGRWKRTPKQVTRSVPGYDEYGRKDGSLETSTWKLGAEGLPVSRTGSSGDRVSLVWTKLTRVKLSDGTCPGQEGCSNPQLEQIAKALKAGYGIEVGEPTRKARTATEVWFMPGKKVLAEKLVKDHLASAVKPENVKEWTWGGTFDLFVVVGPE